MPASREVGGSQWPRPVQPGDPNLASGDRERQKVALASPSYPKHGSVANPRGAIEGMDYETSVSMSRFGQDFTGNTGDTRWQAGAQTGTPYDDVRTPDRFRADGEGQSSAPPRQPGYHDQGDRHPEVGHGQSVPSDLQPERGRSGSTRIEYEGKRDHTMGDQGM